MKTALQYLLISFIGSLLALACFGGILQLIDNYNDETSAPFNQEKQLIEAQETIHCFKLMLDNIPDDFFIDVVEQSYYWKTIKQYFEKYDDPYDYNEALAVTDKAWALANSNALYLEYIPAIGKLYWHIYNQLGNDAKMKEFEKFKK